MYENITAAREGVGVGKFLSIMLLVFALMATGATVKGREPWKYGKFIALVNQGEDCIFRDPNKPSKPSEGCKLAATLVGAYIAGLMDAMELEGRTRIPNGLKPHFCLKRNSGLTGEGIVLRLVARAIKGEKEGRSREEVFQWVVRSMLLLEMVENFPCKK